MRDTLCSASRWANIHATTGAVSAAQLPALLAGLGGRRGPNPDLGDFRLDDNLSASMVCSWSSACQSTRPPTSGVPQLDALMLEQRRHRGVSSAVEGSLVFPITIASQPRSGSASAETSVAACGRRAQASVRL
jgi:hypothetical protein